MYLNIENIHPTARREFAAFKACSELYSLQNVSSKARLSQKTTVLITHVSCLMNRIANYTAKT